MNREREGVYEWNGMNYTDTEGRQQRKKEIERGEEKIVVVATTGPLISIS